MSKKPRGKRSKDRYDLWETIPWSSDGAESIIHGLMLSLDIEEENTQFKTAVGRAWVEDRIIKIPQLFDTPKKFLVALHEIGHIKNGKIKFKYSIEEEYAAEMYAINLATSLGIVSNNSINRYTVSAKEYVLRYLTSNVIIKNLPKNLIDWLNNDELNIKYYDGVLEEIDGNL